MRLFITDLQKQVAELQLENRKLLAALEPSPPEDLALSEAPDNPKACPDERE